jgi:hypothetical protein
VSAQVVVLHRISADSSGAIDSVRTGASGAYRFRYTLDGPRSMYIVSARYSGVAYFTTPLRDRTVTSPEADVSVYDTTSAAFPLTIRARHVVIAPAEAAGVRRVVDVYEVSNDSSRTLVTGASGPTWHVTLPPAARDPGSSGGDLPPEAFRFVNGRAELLVPFPPGARQVVLTYAIPVESSVPLMAAEPTASLEVLLEGSGATVSGAGLAAEAPVTMEGRTFQRFRASAVPAGASFAVETEGMSGSASRIALLLVAAVAVALGVVLARRAPTAVTATLARPLTESLAREIAALDQVYAKADSRAGEGARFYDDRRTALIGRLVEAQAVEDRDTAT